jgi:hypothetical protein
MKAASATSQKMGNLRLRFLKAETGDKACHDWSKQNSDKSDKNDTEKQDYGH